MKVLLINEVCGHTSTGKICAQLAEEYEAEGHTVKIAYGRSSYVPDEYKKYGIRIGNDWTVRIHALKTRLFDAHGFGSRKATKRFLKWADEYKPDFIWLHNLHGYYVNIELLFRWIKSRPQMKVRWTLHDCWAFTGHCAHFTMAKCDRWKEGCHDCPKKREYPASRWMDRSKENYWKKKEIFCGVNNMTIITPSQWLAGLVRQSYLQEYPIEVRHNKIDETVFKPTLNDYKKFRKKHGLENKKIILAVANIWGEKKGLYDYLELAKLLDERFKIVMVGLAKAQIKELPGAIIGIERTESSRELAALYSMADVFVNMTYEDNYPTVNLEAEACGTPVITYDTGGCRETIRRKDSKVVETGKVEKVFQIIERVYG